MHMHATPIGIQQVGGRRRPEERRRLLMTLTLTAAILIAELIGGYLSNSLALIADAGHMFTDALAIGLAYLALGFAMRPATVKKTYGWYRLEILAALVNGVTLVVISLFIFWEAYERLMEPPEVAIGTMLFVATIGLAANALGLVFLSGHDASLNMRGAYLHVLGDLLSSVGVLAGGLVMWVTGNYIVDPLLSGAIGVVIVIGAYRLVREAVDVLLEATPVGMDLRAVGEAVAGVDGVEGVHDLHIWSLTSGLHALSCHVEVKTDNLAQADAILDRINSMLQARFDLTHTTIQIESESYKEHGLVHWRLPREAR